MNVQQQIESLLKAGRVVVEESWPTVCLRTDAITGQASKVWGDFATRDEAQLAVNTHYVDDGTASIRIIEPQPPVEVTEFNLF